MRIDLTSRQTALPLGLLWLAAIAVGLVGVTQRLVNGHEQADYGSYIPWGLWVGMYIFLAGLSAGLSSLPVWTSCSSSRCSPGCLARCCWPLLRHLALLLFIWLDLVIRSVVVYTN